MSLLEKENMMWEEVRKMRENPTEYDRKRAEKSRAYSAARKAAGLDANIRATIERIRKQSQSAQHA